MHYVLYRYDFVFFFQAEDGIRDIGVTGVQTCALPIWARAASRRRGGGRRSRARAAPPARGRGAPPPAAQAPPRPRDRKRGGEGKRVDLGGGRIIKKKKKNDGHNTATQFDQRSLITYDQ